MILSIQACGPDFQSVLKGRLAAGAAAAANVVAAAVNTFFSIIHTPAQVTAGGIFLPFLDKVQGIKARSWILVARLKPSKE